MGITKLRANTQVLGGSVDSANIKDYSILPIDIAPGSLIPGVTGMTGATGVTGVGVTGATGVTGVGVTGATGAVDLVYAPEYKAFVIE